MQKIEIINIGFGERSIHLHVSFAVIRKVMRKAKREEYLVASGLNWRNYDEYGVFKNDNDEWVLTTYSINYDELDGTAEIPVDDPSFWAPVAAKFRRLIA